MLQESPDSGLRIFQVIIGLVFILMVFSKPRSSNASDINPAFEWSANIRKWLGRLALVMFGLGFMVEGAGTLLFPAEIVPVIVSLLMGGAIVIFVAVFVALLVGIAVVRRQKPEK